MKEAQISWHILKDESVELIEREYFAGAFSPSNIEAVFDMQVWNNKWGIEDVKNIETPVVSIMFDSIEDSKLLEFCKIKIDNGSFVSPEIINNKAIVPLNKTLFGKANQGTIRDTENYADISIKFGPITYGMRNGLKSLLVDLQYNK